MRTNSFYELKKEYNLDQFQKHANFLKELEKLKEELYIYRRE